MSKSPIDLRLASELRMVLTRLIKKLRTKSETGLRLSLTERSTLARLDQHPELTPTELAGMEKITNQSMSQILKHLLALGYIDRKPSRTDRRIAIISITKLGQNVIYRVRNERDEWLSKAIASTCNTREQESLQRNLEILKKLVDFD